MVTGAKLVKPTTNVTATTATKPCPSKVVYYFRTVMVPLTVIVLCPVLNVLLWMICRFYDGSLPAFLHASSSSSFSALVIRHWPQPDLMTVALVSTYAIVEALLMIIIPGARHKGPITPAGNQPTYKLNGIGCYLATTAILLAAFYSGVLPLPLVYDQLGKILLFLSIEAFALCFVLYFKGLYFPSSTDAGSSGNFVWDFYWGTELHPQIFNFNIKQYCNCRLGMMGWHVLLFCFAAKQYDMLGYVSNSMVASILIQEIYIFKFFVWESGYFGSIDIMHDRFGFYICWGVLCWIAGVYTLVGQYLVRHPTQLSPFQFFLVVGLGIFFIWANYDADAQRQLVRDTKGNCKIWGSTPKTLVAKYNTTDGKEHQTLLLLSGWWGIARHAHYITEILLSLMWTIPVGVNHSLPYFYVVYLSILLLDRAYRDEQKCYSKYGNYWKQYCAQVPYSIIPFIY